MIALILAVVKGKERESKVKPTNSNWESDEI